MPVEMYYAPTKRAQKVSLKELAEKLQATGLPCKIEPEAENMFWLVFDGMASNMLASVEEGVFVFGTFNFAGEDPTTVPETMERTMQAIGFSADEGDEY